jgi:hypothetical protein
MDSFLSCKTIKRLAELTSARARGGEAGGAKSPSSACAPGWPMPTSA